MKRQRGLFSKKWIWTTIRCLILFDLLFLEFVLPKWLQGDLSCLYFWFAIGGITLFIVLFVVGLCFKDNNGHHAFKRPNREMVRRLFENVAGGDWFTVFLLLFFLIHLEMIYYNVTAFYYEEGKVTFLYYILSNLVAIVLSLFLYPKSISDRATSERPLMVMGLSSSFKDKVKREGNLVSFNNIDLLLKPLVSGKFKGLKKVIIIPSAPIASFELDTKAMGQFEEYCEKNNIAFENDTYEKICNRINSGGFDLKKVAQEFLPFIDSNCSIEDIVFDVHEPLDYDSFPECVCRIDGLLKKERKESGYETCDTLLYINPGTGVIGSALSAFAIPGSRQIVYAPQVDRGKEIQVFDVDPKGMSGIYSEISNNP